MVSSLKGFEQQFLPMLNRKANRPSRSRSHNEVNNVAFVSVILGYEIIRLVTTMPTLATMPTFPAEFESLFTYKCMKRLCGSFIVK